MKRKSRQSPRKCRFGGCDNHVHGHDYCSGHVRQLKAGTPLAVLKRQRKRGSEPIVKYREAICDVPGLEGPCHVFIGFINDAGYGQLWHGNKAIGSHRYTYERVNGKIPDGLVIDHVCRNRACCNALHLRAVTVQINSTENIQGAAWQLQAMKTRCIKGHPFDEANTYIHSTKGTRECRRCRADREHRRRNRENT